MDIPAPADQTHVTSLFHTIGLLAGLQRSYMGRKWGRNLKDPRIGLAIAKVIPVPPLDDTKAIRSMAVPMIPAGKSGWKPDPKASPLLATATAEEMWASLDGAVTQPMVKRGELTVIHCNVEIHEATNEYTLSLATEEQ